jgi:mono/diheme cytochrome c family protein
MNSKLIGAFTACAIALGAATAAHAQQNSSEAHSPDVGKHEYDMHCAQCHGLSGKGDGPFARRRRSGAVPANLTELSNKNGGAFPFTRVYQTIDGRLRIKAHGPADMPIWGQVYKIESRNLNPIIYNHEVFAHAKILEVIEYIYRLQAK